MNNRFKFRVWDKITNQYLQELGIYYWHIPYSLDGEEITGEANLVGLSELLKHDNFVTQQYTGLTDINDKEIYEGDILSECIDNRTELGICKQILGGWKIFSHPNSSICWHGNQHKVIGNIFETPELLKTI